MSRSSVLLVRQSKVSRVMAVLEFFDTFFEVQLAPDPTAGDE